jgi:uncharacterized protein (UPF0548 family)
MFTLLEPSKHAAAFLRRAATRDFSYPEVGATRGTLPVVGYDNDHNRVKLGEGAQIFRRAAAALRSWEMFNLGWVRVSDPSTPIRVDATAAVLIRHFGFWSLNAARIIYVIDEDRRFGFAYGTLRDHSETGEERFCVEWDEESDSVYYDILAFSRPRQWHARLGKPLARMLQRKFVRESKLAMQRAVDSF